VIVKLDSRITPILSDTSLFTHYIEEILIFSQRLFEEDIDYPQHLPNCMNLLCDEIVFEKWFQVEQDGSYFLRTLTKVRAFMRF
jgi:bacillopeptidase F (M6 metalloprotease family)